MIPVRKAVILSGERGTGKTTLCLKLAEAIPGAGGIVCPALFDGAGSKTGFECIAIDTGENWDLGSVRLETGSAATEHSTGRYIFDEAGVHRSIACIRESIKRDNGTTIIDEIGPLELRGGGFAPVLPLLVDAPNLIIVVRPDLIEEVHRLVPDHHTRAFRLTVLNREKLAIEIATFLGDPDGPGGSS